MLSTTYPSGITIECERDSLARIENIIMIDLDGTRTDILSDARYRPYGGVTQRFMVTVMFWISPMMPRTGQPV